MNGGVGGVSFVETAIFSLRWRELELADDELDRLQRLIADRPHDFPLVPGTGGLRKARFAPAARMRGKRGSLRVCYAPFIDYGQVLLVTVYDKRRREDLTPEEKKGIREVIRIQKRMLARQFGY